MPIIPDVYAAFIVLRSNDNGTHYAKLVRPNGMLVHLSADYADKNDARADAVDAADRHQLIVVDTYDLTADDTDTDTDTDYDY
jgi:hypothetical protein